MNSRPISPLAIASGDAAFQYVGSELAIFEKAANWKRYWSRKIAPYVGCDVLEVGAGIGANTRLLVTELPFRSWTCLEPDASLAAAIQIPMAGLHSLTGTTGDLPPSALFDSILYIDVLEHIEDDRAEMTRAAAHLKPGGHVIVLSPAHQSLYTPFDAAIGHFRRYSRESLSATAPAGLQQRSLVYLDAAGMLASLANRLVLSQSMPTERQILTWDRLLVPLSRVVDPLLGWRVGKSVLGVWQRVA